ncbi:MAG: TolC family protein [Candidatus Eisenbacteria bacterium]|uniref:TolC family protein n=1 Tax=Eiseniibacteriota bacterium TaxID=2212470 RepID=A0A538TGL0_UNCEI|nr:MAG: TolC family protein [Candidatus Eisenbacteria bacterium]
MNLGKSKRIVALAPLLMAFALSAAPAFGAEHRMTLDEAINLALQKNEGLLIERESFAAAKAAVSSASGAYDPVAELDGGWSRSNEPLNSSFSGTLPNQIAPEASTAEGGVTLHQLLPTGGALSLRGRAARDKTEGSFARLSPAYSTRVGVELRQPLLRDRAIDGARLSVRVAKAGRRQADASLRRTLTETVAAVEQAYWALTAARLGVGVREEAVRLAEEQLNETRTRVQTGAVPGTEVAQPRAELERRRSELLAARETTARAENDLKLLILEDTDESMWLSEIAPADSAAVEVTPVDVAASLQRALAARPELGAARAVVERRHAETSFARSGVWPALDAVASYDRFGLAGSRNPAGPAGPLPSNLDGALAQSFQSLGDGDFDAARVALVLSLPIRNRTARAEADIARHVERQAEADLVRVRKAIRAEVLDAASALETAGQRIESSRAGREAAEVQLSAEKDRYETGLSTNFLVLTRQNDLSRARLDEISALTDYRMARAEMGRATGSLIEERGINVNGTRR